MVEVVTDMVRTTHMVIIPLVRVTLVVDNHRVMHRVTTLIDINHIVLGVLGVMDHSMETEVLEVVKVSW